MGMILNTYFYSSQVNMYTSYFETIRFNKRKLFFNFFKTKCVIDQKIKVASMKRILNHQIMATADQQMNLVFVSAEVAPWSKSGGLGDVVGALPIALANRGHRVMTVAPRYDQYSDAWDTSITINIDGHDIRY